ncbi:MAG: MgtC/SapB family protein [Caulobacteraceae bacterium]
MTLTIVAGALIGLDRGESGHAAGLRTTILVCVAAAVSMIQANLLLPTVGKASDSFVVLDLMRLPLGILSGMGFIGAGAILRKDDIVIGVTTAATLWFVTVIGLCLGGGQIWLGVAVTVVALLALWAMKRVDTMMKRERRAVLTVLAMGDDGLAARVVRVLEATAMRASYLGGRYDATGEVQELNFDVRWRSAPPVREPSEFISAALLLPGVRSIEWKS